MRIPSTAEHKLHVAREAARRKKLREALTEAQQNQAAAEAMARARKAINDGIRAAEAAAIAEGRKPKPMRAPLRECRFTVDGRSFSTFGLN